MTKFGQLTDTSPSQLPDITCRVYWHGLCTGHIQCRTVTDPDDSIKAPSFESPTTISSIFKRPIIEPTLRIMVTSGQSLHIPLNAILHAAIPEKALHVMSVASVDRAWRWLFHARPAYSALPAMRRRRCYGLAHSGLSSFCQSIIGSGRFLFRSASGLTS